MPKNCADCGGQNVIQATECEACGGSFRPPSQEVSWPYWVAALAVFAIIGTTGNWLWNRSTGDDGKASATKACVTEAYGRDLRLQGTASEASRRGDGWRLVGLLDDGRAYVCTAEKQSEGWTVASLVVQGD